MKWNKNGPNLKGGNVFWSDGLWSRMWHRQTGTATLPSRAHGSESVRAFQQRNKRRDDREVEILSFSKQGNAEMYETPERYNFGATKVAITIAVGHLFCLEILLSRERIQRKK